MSLVDDVRGEVLEVGAGEAVAVLAAVDGMAAAVLHAQELGDALVELVVARRPMTSSPSAFSASIVGSSWNSADTSGLAPIRSPAPTVIVLGFAVRRALMCVARYSMPPAGTVFCVQPVWTPALSFTATQHPTWTVPGVFGCR